MIKNQRILIKGFAKINFIKMVKFAENLNKKPTKKKTFFTHFYVK